MHNIERDIGLTREVIITNWIKLYTEGDNVWHINHIIKGESSSKEEDDIIEKKEVDNNVDGIMNINEWEAFSQMGPTIIVSLNDLDILKRHEFDRNYQ